MITIEFTEEEIRAQLELNHRAVLHSGMQVAEAAVALRNKYLGALQAAGTPARPNNGKAAEEVNAATP